MQYSRALTKSRCALSMRSPPVIHMNNKQKKCLHRILITQAQASSEMLMLLPSDSVHPAGAPQFTGRPCRFCHLFSPIRHYFPDCWAVNWTAAGAPHGNCTPPRISPSCTDCLCLSLCRSTIVGRWDHGETACQSRFYKKQKHTADRQGLAVCVYIMSTEQSKKPCGARHSGPFVV